jgi:hypothetical protein
MIRFPCGQIVATPGALEAFNQASPGETHTALRRHLTGDWGDVCDEDKRANDAALKIGSRLMSSYHLSTGVKIWIITEADRSSTTLLLPEEY